MLIVAKELYISCGVLKGSGKNVIKAETIFINDGCDLRVSESAFNGDLEYISQDQMQALYSYYYVDVMGKEL